MESNFIDLKYDGLNFGSKQLNLLSKVSENIQRLDLSNVDISDINSSKLKKLKNLKYLNLTNSNLSTNDLNNLPESIEILILSKNIINPEELSNISSRPQIKKVFAYNTIQDNELKKSLENKINSAKKYESKGKNKKAKKRYERALKLLVKANKAIDPYNNDILFDGQLASLDFRDGKWNGFIHEENEEKAKQLGRVENSGNLIVDFDLPKNKNVTEIAISCMESINNGFILLPESISLFDISDGKEQLINSVEIPKSTVDEADSKRLFKLSVSQKNLKKVRLKIKSNRKLPKGHVAEGQPGWLFVDEIYLL